MSIDYQAMHAQLLDMLGAKGHQDAARIIAGHHACELARQSEGVSEEDMRIAQEGLEYFDRTGDAGDKEYVRAILAVWHNRPAQDSSYDGKEFTVDEVDAACKRAVEAYKREQEKAELMATYQQALQELAANRCVLCKGLGSCDDLEPGDISCREWVCPHCKGTGFAAPPGERVRVPIGWALVEIEHLQNADIALSISNYEGGEWTEHESPRWEIRKYFAAPEATQMTAEERVKSQYPYAYAYEFAGERPWIIYATRLGDPGHRGDHLSSGCETCEQAWSDAANKLEAAPEADHD